MNEEEYLRRQMTLWEHFDALHAGRDLMELKNGAQIMAARRGFTNDVIARGFWKFFSIALIVTTRAPS